MTLDEARAAHEASGSVEWLLLPDLALPMTRWALCDLHAAEWRFAGAYFRGLIEREPVRSSPHYAGVRILLGTLAGELDTMTEIVGDEPAETLDLHDRRGARELAEYVASVEALAAHGVVIHAT